MQISDYLSLFSVEDLRTLADRRGFLVPEEALKGRQMLVRALSAALSRHDGVYNAISGLNRAEVEVLRQVLHAGRSTGLSAVASAMGAEPAAVREVLDSLRLWGLLFPEGDWEHLAVPPQTRVAQHYLPPPQGAALELCPPPLNPVEVSCQARPASLGVDIAELLARIARTRHKLTQAGRINRRDLRSMEAGMAVETPGYGTFISFLVTSLGLLEYRTHEQVLRVRDQAETWLAQPEQVRGTHALDAWIAMRGYAESSPSDPAEAEYLPVGLSVQRSRAAQRLEELTGGQAYRVGEFQAQLSWATPFSFQQRDAARDYTMVVGRLLRSLYWLGLVALDHPEQPQHFQLTPLGMHVLQPEAPGTAPLVPEEPRFFLQPNAEVFAPPNLAPRTLFHLRRITGEKKGGPLGVYPLTQESLRRALDAGIEASTVIAFLERFSRTGLPANVRTMVETAGRQHGRIRLVPAEYVLVTDDPALLEELHRLKTVEPLLGKGLTERVTTVAEQHVQSLLRQLRQRGYAPLNEAEVEEGLEFPADPDAEPPPLPVKRPGPSDLLLGGSWSELDEVETPPLPAPGEPVYDQQAIQSLLAEAEECGFEVEMEYRGLARGEATVRKIHPFHVGGGKVEAYCALRQEERLFNIDRIAWARLTGEVFTDE